MTARPTAGAGRRLDAYRHCACCHRLFLPSQPWQRYCLRRPCQRTRQRIAARRVRQRNRQRIAAQARARYHANPEPKRAYQRARYAARKAAGAGGS